VKWSIGHNHRLALMRSGPWLILIVLTVRRSIAIWFSDILMDLIHFWSETGIVELWCEMRFERKDEWIAWIWVQNCFTNANCHELFEASNGNWSPARNGEERQIFERKAIRGLFISRVMAARNRESPLPRQTVHVEWTHDISVQMKKHLLPLNATAKILVFTGKSLGSWGLFPTGAGSQSRKSCVLGPFNFLWFTSQTFNLLSDGMNRVRPNRDRISPGLWSGLFWFFHVCRFRPLAILLVPGFPSNAKFVSIRKTPDSAEIGEIDHLFHWSTLRRREIRSESLHISPSICAQPMFFMHQQDLLGFSSLILLTMAHWSIQGAENPSERGLNLS
jgi:hypothetical protein